MKIVQTQNGYVVGFYTLTEVPPEFLGHMGETFHILEDFQQDVVIGWRYENGDFLPPIEVITTFGRVITVPAYRNRFTRAEKRLIKAASYGTEPSELDLASDLDHLASTPYVHLDRAYETRITLALEQMGLLEEGRAQQILSSPVYSNELLMQTRVEFGIPAIPSETEMLVNNGKGYESLNDYLKYEGTTSSDMIR